MKYEIMRTDEVNRNGRTYPRAVIEKIIMEWPENGVPGRIGVLQEIEVPVERIKFFAHNPEMVDNRLMAEIRWLPNTHVMYDHAYVANGVGTLKDGVVQDDYKITSVSVIPIEDSSWEN